MSTQVPYPDMSFQVALQARPNSSDNPQWTDATELVQQAESINRGHPYQVPTGQASTPRVTIRDPQELFNVANTVDSPFINSTGGRNIQPYRGACWQCMHPRSAAGGNLWNLNNWRVPIDPSFDSYAVGPAPSWVQQLGFNAPQITATGPLQGTKSVTTAITGGSGAQGIFVNMATIPGRYYLVQALVNQSAANTVALFIQGHGVDIATTALTATTVKLSGVFYADQPQLQAVIGCHAPANTGTLLIDAIMYEPVTPLNPTGVNFNGQNGGAGTLGGFGTVNNLVASVSKAQGGYHLSTVRLHPDGVTADPQFQSPRFAVNANTAYALHGILFAPSVSRSLTVWWYTAGGAFISSNQLTFTGSASDWTVPDALQVTSPATAGQAQIGTESNAASNTDWWIDTVALLPATPSAFTTTGSVVYPIFRGWVERWPRRHESSGFEGFADLQLVDGFAALSSVRLHTEYAAAVMATNPAYYWRLNEIGGSISYADSAGSGVSLQRFDGPFGPAPTFSTGAATNILGDPGGAGLNVDTGTISGNVPASVAQAGAFAGAPGISLGNNSPLAYSVAFWMARNTDRLFGGQTEYAWGMADNNNFNNCQVYGSDGTPNQFFMAAPWPPNGGGSLAVTDQWGDGVQHLYVMTVSATSGNVGTATFYIDGVQVGSNGTGIFTPTGNPLFTWVQLGGFMARFHNNIPGVTFPNLILSHFALWNRVLSAAEVTDLVNAGKGYPGEVPGVRLPRHLSRGGYPAGNNNIPSSRISTGRSTLGPSSSVERTPALTDAQGMTLAEAGTLWIAPDGALVFESRDDRFKRISPTMTFGEDFANSEIPYLPGFLYGLDPLYTYADVKVTQTQGVIATGGRTADIAAATAQFFNRSYTPPTSVDLLTALQTQDYADWVFYSHNVPQQRLEAVVVDPMSNPALWSFVLNAEIGQRVRVRRRPRGLTGNLLIDQPYFIEQITHGQINFDTLNSRPLSWKTVFTLTPIPANTQPWILDDVNLSVLGQTTRLGF